MTRSARRGPQPRHGDIRHLDDDQWHFLATGRHHFPLEPDPFPDMATAKAAWHLHRDEIIRWARARWPNRPIWGVEQFDLGEDQ